MNRARTIGQPLGLSSHNYWQRPDWPLKSPLMSRCGEKRRRRWLQEMNRSSEGASPKGKVWAA